MKKLFGITIGMIMISSVTLQAQHDVKVNFIGLLFKSYGAGYDYVINDEMSAGLSFSYSTSILGLKTDGHYSALKITPDFRFYTNPEDGADGFYFGGYLTYAKVNFNDLIAAIPTETYDPYYGYNVTTFKDVPYNISLNGIAVGIELGKKWVTNSGVFFETNFGFGRYLSKSVSYSNNEVSKYYEDNDITGDEDGINWLYTFDWKFGLNVGYRFGQ